MANHDVDREAVTLDQRGIIARESMTSVHDLPTVRPEGDDEAEGDADPMRGGWVILAGATEWM